MDCVGLLCLFVMACVVWCMAIMCFVMTLKVCGVNVACMRYVCGVGGACMHVCMCVCVRYVCGYVVWVVCSGAVCACGMYVYVCMYVCVYVWGMYVVWVVYSGAV